ncbi:pilus assembly PilX N-terminal domain-containing protein [Luteolibacter sp. AS25]|uniref:pilus assembly PilX N-terminal domain-containing protein n=1 Tax=Luteolibacter sp. AS25 TaxID=3135776 RepID=UPI00398BA656
MKLGRNGFALPMTIIAIAGLTLLLVGLITVLSLERKTARSYSDTTRAEFAVESGLAVAIASLTEIALRDDSVVFRLEDPVEAEVETTDRPLGYREQFFTYGAIFEQDNADPTTGVWRGIPLFSGAAETELGSTDIEADKLTADLTLYVDDAVTLSTVSEHDQNIPRAQWVEVPSDDEDGYTFRYAYWVEDLSGRLPGKTVGEESPRAEGLSTAELDIATILDPSSETGGMPATMDGKRNNMQTSATLRQILSEDEAKTIEPYIHYYDVPEIQIPKRTVPQGFGYQSAGEIGEDLNTFITDKDVDGLAEYISAEIPDFESRKGGFPATEDYVKTLAASIIDYADTDSDATTGTGYRGIDSYPFVNELFDRYEWVTSPANTVSIEVDTYIELWNPSDKAITGSIKFTNINKRKILIGGNGEKDFTTANFGPTSVSIPANGFRVLHLGPETYNFPTDLEPSDTIEFNADDSDSSFEMYWNDVLVDKPRGGVERTSGLLRAGLSNRKWKGNGSPSLDHSIGQYGDPRASYYINDFFYRTDYADNSSWGGRAIKPSISKAATYREVRLEEWPDKGSNSTIGVAPGTDARVPTETQIVLKSSGAAITGKTFPVNQPELAPGRISNSGEFESLGELGNIFDPAQWLDVEEATFSSSDKVGGAITLAIGRPEYAAFDQQGKRAAQLLDLFSLDQTGKTVSLPININTAPREVLRSLMAGITFDEDPVATEVKLEKSADDPEIGDIFADTVIAWRNAFPLRGISDLNLIREDPTDSRDYEAITNQPFFGSSETFADEPAIEERADTAANYDQTDYKEWNDAGREELFRKVMEMVSFRSNLFRIVVTGEVVNSSGKTISRSKREFHYGIFPERDASGVIVEGGSPSIIKYYEKTY